ncbi:hypothetical protein [Bacillus sp. 1P06AnD]|uniref:hypothetical protein n=1 Tax=Bacillus sp. 1P06AnD TaxID=3132208 RepID=UPI0039A24EA2
MSKEQLGHLCKVANGLGANVLFTEDKKLCFNSETLMITAPFKWDIEDLYGLAHEIGHLKDHLEQELDYDLWRNNSAYRLNVEMKAWTHSYGILVEAGIDTSCWNSHVNQKLSSYLNFAYQSLDALETAM